MQKSDVDNAQELASLLFDLTQNEGNSVKIVHPNPDFDGPNSTIYFNTNFGERSFGETKQYFGESVIDCLKQAKSEHDTGSDHARRKMV